MLAVSFLLAPEIALLITTLPVESTFTTLFVLFPKARVMGAVPEPPENPAIVRLLSSALRRITLLTEFTVAPPNVRVALNVDKSLLPIAKSLGKVFEATIAPSVRDPLALELLPTPALAVVLLKFIPNAAEVPLIAVAPKTAVSPALPSIVEVAYASTPGILLVAPPVQLAEFIQAVLVTVVLRV